MPERIEPLPLVIRVTNNTDEIRYIRYGDFLPRCQYLHGESWNTCRLSLVGQAMEECIEANLNTNCCLSVEFDSTVYTLLPGSVREYQWNGTVYEENSNHCSNSCVCLENANASVGRYRISLTVFPSATCTSDDHCDLNTDGTAYAFTTGEASIVETEFTLPTTDSEFEMVITK